MAPTPPSAPTAAPDGPKQEKSNQPSADAHGDAVQKKTSIASRFVLAIKAILFSSIINVLLVFVPVGIAVRKFHPPQYCCGWHSQVEGTGSDYLVDFAKLPAGVVFAMNAIAIIPLAGLLSYATESVASRLGDTIGALMNVTFGNAVELIIFM